ncbi:hypothetical protein KJ673_01065 [Patescibacteria group bacterium]|nr:hypothetical protein [Patescibacteria group bacterium]MBU4453154.1 hypothetical protein [Patescibacteria group bacterium]MCG2687442.1 hypothetical protein [Candidatus Parcubacteria bacterium]
MQEFDHEGQQPYAEIGFEGIESELENVQRNEAEGVYTGEFRVRDNVVSIKCKKVEGGWDVVMTDSSPIKDLGKFHISKGVKNLRFALQEARNSVESRLNELDRLHPTIEHVQQELGQFGEVGEITLTEAPGRTTGYTNTRYEGQIVIGGSEYMLQAEVDHSAGTTQYPDVLPWTVRLTKGDRSVTKGNGRSLVEVMESLKTKYLS